MAESKMQTSKVPPSSTLTKASARKGSKTIGQGVAGGQKQLSKPSRKTIKPKSQPDIHHQLPECATFNHMLEYPMLCVTVTFLVDGNPLGRMYKAVFRWAFDTFARPLLPILYSKPLSLAGPLAAKVDGLGDSILSALDKMFPSLRKPFSEVVGNVKRVATAPFYLATSFRDRFSELRRLERAKFDENEGGIMMYLKTRISTSCLIASEMLVALSDWITENRESALEDEDGDDDVVDAEEDPSDGDDSNSEVTAQEPSVHMAPTSLESS